MIRSTKYTPIAPYSLRRGLVALFAFCGLVSGVQIAHAGTIRQETILLKKPSVKTGDMRRYRLVLEMHGKSPDGDKKVKVVEKYSTAVKEAKADGSFTLVYTFETADAVVDGQAVDALKYLPVVTVMRTADGVFSAKAEGGTDEGNAEVLGVLQQLAASYDTFYPFKTFPRVVHTGDQWKLSYSNANLMIGGPKLQGTAELKGTEKLQDRETLQVKFSADGDEKVQGGKTHTEGLLNIDPATGEIVKYFQKGSGKFAGGTADVELTVTPLGLDSKTDPKE